MSELGLGTPETRSAPREVRRRRSHGVLATLIALAVVVALLGGLLYAGRNMLSGILPNGGPEDYPGPGTGSVTVQVTGGDSISAIGRTLETSGIIASSQAFLDAASDHPAATGIQPGTYEMRHEMSAAGALELLVDPANRVVTSVTLPEGLRLEESLARLSQGTGIPYSEFEIAIVEGNSLNLPAYAGGGYEGFIFPATYEFEPDDTAADVLSATITRFLQAASTVNLEAGAAALGRTPDEVVIVASIIEAETTRPEDMARVARVLYNRLADGMLLQLDSTVAYAVGITGEVFTTDEQRQSTSPYNTYRYPGLPPGPIDSPGEAAMAAALNPAVGDWRYFVAVDLETGDTRFSVTKEEHDANVLLLQAYCQQSEVC